MTFRGILLISIHFIYFFLFQILSQIYKSLQKIMHAPPKEIWMRSLIAYYHMYFRNGKPWFYGTGTGVITFTSETGHHSIAPRRESQAVECGSREKWDYMGLNHLIGWIGGITVLPNHTDIHACILSRQYRPFRHCGHALQGFRSRYGWKIYSRWNVLLIYQCHVECKELFMRLILTMVDSKKDLDLYLGLIKNIFWAKFQKCMYNKTYYEN